ncbi:MAG: phytanoyl-CoA dioxygenase family protein [Fimbriimonadaceae bacterium]|nr:phytanoyl-CoA dioxygenase family protein [Fimbriimonadaceae bacterium]
MAETVWFEDEHSDDYPESLYRFQGVVPMIETLADFDESAMEVYRAVGVVGVRRAFDPEEVQAVINALAELVSRESLPEGVQLQFESRARDILPSLHGPDRLDAVRKFMLFVHLDSRLERMVYHPALMPILQSILGEDPHMFQDMALLKPPGIGREKPWHQDNAYFKVPQSAEVVGVWAALDEATEQNGCMFFRPGGHRSGPLPHFNRRDWQICDSDILDLEAVSAPLPAGGMVIFNGLTPHGTPSNRSNTRRRALQFHYRGKSVQETSDQERLDTFGAEGVGASC